MSTSTMTGQAKNATMLFANSSLAFDTAVQKRYFDRDGAKVLELSNVPVFRSGTFRDSRGYQHTYDDLHINQFVMHYDHLRTQKIFSDIPVRKGHPSFGQNSMDGLIGYVVALSTEKRSSPADGREQTYLLATFEILEAEAQAKIDSGLWRNRSAEVGTYVDNNEAEYAPTFMGVAYVDIPAVEGLNGFTKSLPTGNTSYMMEEEMTGLTTPPAPGEQAPTEAPFAFSIGGSATTDHAAVQAYVTGLEAKVAGFERAEADRVAAEKVRVAAERDAFVTSLAAEGKVLAPQVESIRGFAQGLSVEQFQSWSAMFEGTAPNPLLQDYGNQSGDAGHRAAGSVDTDKQVVEHLAYANVSTEAIKKTDAYKAAIAKDPSFQIPQTAHGQ